jgi:hypothetical protein
MRRHKPAAMSKCAGAPSRRRRQCSPTPPRERVADLAESLANYWRPDRSNKLNVRIPFSSKSTTLEPLRRCIEQTAARSELTEYAVALIAAYFFEAVADQVSLGHAVSIPGFDLFGVRQRHSPGDPDGSPRCYPHFSAARGLRQQIVSACPPDAPAVAALMRHRKHHHPSSKPERRDARTSTALDAFRQQIVAQAVTAGMDSSVVVRSAKR